MAVIERAPLAWSEVLPRPGASVVERLVDRGTTPLDLIHGLTQRGTLQQAHEYWFRGGYPQPWLRDSQRFSKIWMEQYFRTYLYRDVARLFPRLDTSRFLLFLQLLAGLAGDVVNYSEVARGHMRDSGLLHHLLRIPDLEALLGHPRHGLYWEGMVIEEFNRQLVCTGEPFEAFYYRTSVGAEVDLVLEGDFGLVPIEIKRGSSVDPRTLRGIRDFVADRGCRFGIVVNNDTAPRLYDERLVGVPFVFL